ncbi:clostripain-related cysteine peptidase [Bdellovibrionota bacterium FG-1]
MTIQNGLRFAFAILVFVVWCGPLAQGAQARKPWSVLIYMAADNELLPYAYWDLYEMEAGYESGRIAAGSTARADMVVQLNTPEAKEGLRFHITQAAAPYRANLKLEDFSSRSPRDIQSPLVAKVSLTTSAGAPISVADDFEGFLEWGLQHYPAEHTLVIVWGHGQGYAGLAYSKNQAEFLSIQQLHDALLDAEQNTLGGKRIDLYASDACLMQTIEVSTEISDVTRFVIGSSQIQNFLGFPYRRMMFEINTGRFLNERSSPSLAGSSLAQDEAFLLARILPKLFKMSVAENGLHGRHLPAANQTATLSSVASDELTYSLLPALKIFASALNRYLDEDPLRAISIENTLHAAPAYAGGSQELGGFLTLMQQMVRDEGPHSLSLAQATNGALAALDRTVVSYALGSHYTGTEPDLYLLRYKGLAVWLPGSAKDLQNRLKIFQPSLFYQQMGGHWQAWMSKVFQ